MLPQRIYDQPSLVVLSAESKEAEAQFESSFDKDRVNFCFCLTGRLKFVFSPTYVRALEEGQSQFIYDPGRSIPFSAISAPHTRVAFLSITLEHLHTLFMGEPPHVLKAENTAHKCYDERPISAPLTVALNQLLTLSASQEGSSIERLYKQGKILEILSLYFSEKRENTESCPFLNDTEMARKIKYAKEYLLKNEHRPPSIRELAKIAGLNEYQLKTGFKQTYGNTIFGFLLDRKLDVSHGLLIAGKHKVNEIAYSVGYTNVSHFISAFKKRFGVTPKKYLASPVSHRSA